ncbi:MAG: CDP-diacylglycerol--serine O-phosphatidyltransferase [Alistipes sp.]|nr:CDP-diacylglycerol--serine O-phosphatidyltransferase [Alistipes sp.]
MKIKLFTIPNFVTLANLLCGAASIVASLVYHNLEVAFWLVIAAAVCDFLDGFTARLLKQYSEIGVQLDSLADMVSFGVAPAAALYMLASQQPAMYEWNEWARAAICFVPFLISGFSALRLAKFNIDTTQHEEFCGLPTPANAILCNSFALVVVMEQLSVEIEWIAMLAVLMSALLVSPIRMFSFKFKSLALKANIVRYLFAIFAVVAISLLQIYAIPIIIVTYIVVSTLLWIFRRSK